MSEAKQVIVIRKDLKMRRGKEVAQGSHASMGAILNYAFPTFGNSIEIELKNTAIKEWIFGRFTKICVYVNSEEELMEIYNSAKNANLNVSLIQDAGLTEFGGIPTYTCLAIGPDYPENIDPITGHLPLL